MKRLSPHAHARLDYVLAAAFALAPTLFGFAGSAATLCAIVAIVYFATSLLTAYPLGIAKLVPFPVHGYLEVALVPLLAASPWLLGFHTIEAARNVVLALAVAIAVVWLTTDYRVVERHPEERFAHPRTT
ncbi:SPW repeat domain-containing protein [Sandaracinus amylolyticus]|uniref:SPW repeat domain-containing protein n=1 Tax=Sandaracinus amylolyticus TaxID=927083 RepID=UPI001F2C25B3|nr:hypothetical protein [Sandaracinus amylolyticus]UJR85592.1 Hypothetical protein I5071_76720 [Sandaracinus amylolyticus]